MFVCRNCRGQVARPLYENVPDRFHRFPVTSTYVTCATCSLVQLEEIPANLGDYYASYRVHGDDSRIYQRLRDLLIGHSYYQAPGDGRTMLDFGCGNGWYVKEMAKLGWNAMGYEPDAAYSKELSQRIGLPVLTGQGQLAEHAGRFDLITLNFVFEHLDDPLRLLGLLTPCLRPGGELYMTVPNIESREARLFKDRWFHLDPPRHVSFFTKTHLRKALQAQGLGDIAFRDVALPTGLAGSLSYRLIGHFAPLAWYSFMLPGLAFSSVVRDGNFAVSARRAA